MSREEVEERCHQRYMAFVAEVKGHIKTFEDEIRADERKQIYDAIIAEINKVGEEMNAYDDIVDDFGFYNEELGSKMGESRGLYTALEIVEGRSGNGE